MANEDKIVKTIDGIADKAIESVSGKLKKPRTPRKNSSAETQTAEEKTSVPPKPSTPPTSGKETPGDASEAEHLAHDAGAAEKPAGETSNTNVYASLPSGTLEGLVFGTVAASSGVIALLLVPVSWVFSLLAIVMGIIAIFFARQTEKAGINATIAKILGVFDLVLGALALFFSLIVLFILAVVRLV